MILKYSGNKLESVISPPASVKSNAPTVELPSNNRERVVIGSTNPKTTQPLKTLIPNNITTEPVPTFGQSTLGNSFARLSTPNPPFNLDYLANTTLPVALTPVDTFGNIIGESTTNPSAYSQTITQHQQKAVQNRIAEISNPFGIPLSSMG